MSEGEGRIRRSEPKKGVTRGGERKTGKDQKKNLRRIFKKRERRPAKEESGNTVL